MTYDASDTRHFYMHDALFNVTGVVENDADVVERYVYSAYGEVTYLNADFTEESTEDSDIDNEHLFTGRRTDPGTGLQYSRYRYYHAPLGRWVNRDPIGYAAGDMNLYGYVEGMPALAVDPFGLQTTLGLPKAIAADIARMRAAGYTARAIARNLRTYWGMSRANALRAAGVTGAGVTLPQIGGHEGPRTEPVGAGAAANAGEGIPEVPPIGELFRPRYWKHSFWNVQVQVKAAAGRYNRRGCPCGPFALAVRVANAAITAKKWSGNQFESHIEAAEDLRVKYDFYRRWFDGDQLRIPVPPAMKVRFG